MTATPDPVAPKLEIESGRLVKWTGEAPEGNPDPIGHPACEEVLEFNCKTGEVRVIYRRDSDASVQ